MTNELIGSIKRKDAKAQKAFYDLYSQRLFKLCFRYVNNEYDAMSILNLGFYIVFKNIGHFIFVEDRSLMVWMQKIMINEALKFLKKKLNYNEKTKYLSIEYESDEVSDLNLNVEDYFQLICRLDEGYRTIFNLYAIEGFSHKEIGQMLNISESTSRSQLSRARLKLKEMILKIDENGK